MESGYNSEEEEDEAMQELFDTINPKKPFSYKRFKECLKKFPNWEKMLLKRKQFALLEACLNFQDCKS